MTTSIEISDYFFTMDEDHKRRYLSKITLIGMDPYCVKMESCNFDVNNFPNILYPDIVNYLLYSKSAYTAEQLKAYKSLEAYNQAVCGWVKKICTVVCGDNVLILGKVMHSQRLNEKLLSPWIITAKTGEVLTAHCDCVAGLGECCTHVAAVLFAVDEAKRKTEQPSCTGVKAYWVQASNRPAEPCPVTDLNLLPPKKRIMARSEEHVVLSKRECYKTDIPPLNLHEVSALISNIAKHTQRGCVLQTISRGFAEEVQKGRQDKHILSSLHKDEYNTKSLEELIQLGDSLDLSITWEECKQIEIKTRQQAKSRDWFKYRAGRITASIFKRACRASCVDPPKSLIKSICYPTNYHIKSKALDYGCTHEADALEQFKNLMCQDHVNVHVEKLGLVIRPQYPYFGASPDGLVDCDCCEMCLIEIKCPYCARETGVESQLEEKSFFLSKEGDTVRLPEDHIYYYQIQMQLALTGLEKCYLVVWSQKDFLIKEIIFNKTFWENESNRAHIFFKRVILPELLGRIFTSPDEDRRSIYLQSGADDWSCIYEETVESSTSGIQDVATEELSQSQLVRPSRTEETPLYCLCQKPDHGQTPMIACDSGFCTIKLFHLACLRLKKIPEKAWFCKSCKAKK